MTSVAALALAGPLLLYGQFGELSSTVDGRHLYFSSTLKFRGAEPDRGEYRIYRMLCRRGIYKTGGHCEFTPENRSGGL